MAENWKEPSKGLYGEPLFYSADEGRRLLEFRLLKRRENAIDLALAQFGYSRAAIQVAVNRGSASTLYAAANNPRVGAALSQTVRIVEQAKYPLLRALLQNRYLPGEFIESLVLRKGGFESIDDDRLHLILLALAGTERLKRPYEPLHLDGFDEYQYHRTFDAIWGLTRSVPTNQRWASALWSLLEATVQSASFDGLESTLSRWQIDEPPRHPGKWFGRSPSFHVRSLIAGYQSTDEVLLKSDDAALRVTFYRRFSPSQYPDWSLFVEQDGEEFFHAALQNKAIWRSAAHREYLRQLAWIVGKEDGRSLDAVNEFTSERRRIEQMHPDWFKEEQIQSPDRISELVGRLEAIEQMLREALTRKKWF